MTLRLQFWKSNESSQLFAFLLGKFWSVVVEPVRVKSMAQIDVFKNNFYSKIVCE